MIDNPKPTSPPWNNITKVVVTLLILVAVVALLIRFQFMITPLILAFILAYLLQPLAELVHRKLNIRWKASVNLIYMVFVVIVLGLLVWGGLALLDQIGKLITFLQNLSITLPTAIQDFIQHPLVIGRSVIDLTKIELLPAAQQILNAVQPLLGRIAEIVASIATGAANVVVWLLFSILISYFILHESSGISGRLVHLELPNYTEDLHRIGHEMGIIWNAFLRRQLLIFLLTIVIYTAFLALVGVRYAFGLALMAGLARFVPYIGPWITWITYGFVANFQGTTLFGMDPLAYALVIVALAILIDTIIDMVVVPRLMADALKLHPGAVMVAALVGLNLFGIIGMILASPILATIKLIYDYARYKIQDEDPWAHILTLSKPKHVVTLWVRIKKFVQNAWVSLTRRNRGQKAQIEKQKRGNDHVEQP